MKFHDLTKNISLSTNNYYVFNNSLIHYKDNIFLMSYRVIKYNLNKTIHPWKFWTDGYKMVQKDIIENNEHLADVYKLYNITKYRKKISEDYVVSLDNDIDNINSLLYEFDGTGIVILKYEDGNFIIEKNINNIFEKDMNQDARLQYDNDQLWITYNAFFICSENNKLMVDMCKRQLFINNNFIYMAPEQHLFNFDHKLVEKNCTLHNSHVLYEINKNFTVYDNINNKFIIGNNDIIKTFKKNNPYCEFSLGTPTISYDGNFLTAGHMKMEYKKVDNSSFLDQINFNGNTAFKKHGKYIYFMFFVLFDNNYNILKMSDLFIPTDNDRKCHLPYLLVFPVGLTLYNDIIFLSYGEGDERTKIIEFSYQEMNKLLKTEHHNCMLLTPDYFNQKKLTVHHKGYFNEWNCGDDAFVLVFKYLNKIYPHYTAIFNSNSNANNNLVVYGGGDIINHYFLKNVSKNDIAFGIGIPYLSLIDELKKFKICYLRNYNDYLNYKDIYNVRYIPDLVWLLPKIYPLPLQSSSQIEKKVK